MTRRFLASLCVTAMGFVLALGAAEPPKTDAKGKTDVAQQQADAALKQEQIKREWEDFKKTLIAVQKRMENSSNPSDRDKAKVLERALKDATEKGVEAMILTLIDQLKKD